MKNKLLLKLFCVFLVSITVCVFCLQNLTYKSYVVPGIVVSKDTEQYAHGKQYRNINLMILTNLSIIVYTLITQHIVRTTLEIKLHFLYLKTNV